MEKPVITQTVFAMSNIRSMTAPIVYARSNRPVTQALLMASCPPLTTTPALIWISGGYHCCNTVIFSRQQADLFGNREPGVARQSCLYERYEAAIGRNRAQSGSGAIGRASVFDMECFDSGRCGGVRSGERGPPPPLKLARRAADRNWIKLSTTRSGRPPDTTHSISEHNTIQAAGSHPPTTTIQHAPTTHPPRTHHAPTTHPPRTHHAPTTTTTHHAPTTHPPRTHHAPTKHPPCTHHHHDPWSRIRDLVTSRRTGTQTSVTIRAYL